MDIVNAMRSFLPLSIICMMLCLTCGALGAGTPPGTAQVVWYHSPVDGSEQAYGVYVPAVTAPLGGYPAVFHAHGYGWSVSTGFRLAAFGGQHLGADQCPRPNSTRVSASGDPGGRRCHTALRAGPGPTLYHRGLDGGRRAPTRGAASTFAAAAGVDGWSVTVQVYHWYAARTCATASGVPPPLLQEASPLYWAERGQWGRHTIVDGRDTTVWPENGLQLFGRSWISRPPIAV